MDGRNRDDRHLEQSQKVVTTRVKSRAASQARGLSTNAFTLVEVLVVIVVITVLLAITLPAITSVRECGQRAACSANQIRLASAIWRFNTAKGFLPGSLNAPGQKSWFVMLLPFMGRHDIPDGPLSEGLCPSAVSITNLGNGLTYGINAGTSAAGAPTYRFHDGAIISNMAAERKSFDDIRTGDGLTNTWLTGDSAGFTIGANTKWHQWSGTTHNLTGVLGFRSSEVTNPPLNNWGSDPRNPPSPNDIPPRSRHPKGVVVSFCDGRTKFLNDEMPVHVYGHLTTSKSIWTGSTYQQVAGANEGAVNSNWANSWLRATGCSLASEEPLHIRDGADY